MNISDIISVNPGQKTLGSLHSEITGIILRKSGIRRDAESLRPNNLSTLIFATSSPRGVRYGISLLMLRLLFAAIMIVSGSFILGGEITAPTSLLHAHAYAGAQIAIGILLAIGFLSRPAMIAGMTGYGYIAAGKIIAGIFSISSLMLCMGCLVFLFIGPGKFSIDFLIRNHMDKKRSA